MKRYVLELMQLQVIEFLNQGKQFVLAQCRQLDRMNSLASHDAQRGSKVMGD